MARAGIEIHVEGEELPSNEVLFDWMKAADCPIKKKFKQHLQQRREAGHTVISLLIPSGFPLLFTLDALRRVLVSRGFAARWAGQGDWCPTMGLEVVVQGVNRSHSLKHQLDVLIYAHAGPKSILYSRIHEATGTYRVVLWDAILTDVVLGIQIPFGGRFELLYHSNSNAAST